MKLENKIVIWTGLGHFSNHIGNYLTAALLIFLQTDIPLTQTERGLLGSIPMILLVLLSVGVGRISDKYPYSGKHLIWLGTIGLGIFSILMSFASSFLFLALATIILGISLSTYHPVAFTFLNNMTNQDRNMGINAVFGNTGSAVTPLIAMFFSVLWGWRIAFLVFAAFQIITGIAILIYFPNTPEFHNQIMNSNTNINGNSKEATEENHVALFVLLLVLISALRAPVFRCISYFTSIIFNDAFMFTEIESSILTAFVLGIGAVGTYIMSVVNNQRIVKGVSRKQRITFRINSLLFSSGGASLLLLMLVIIPTDQSIVLFFAYLVLTFFFFLGASVLPTIMSEITPNNMGSSFGILFSGATLTGAIAPTIFGFLADTYDFTASFLFLGVVALACLILIFLFKFLYNQKS